MRRALSLSLLGLAGLAAQAHPQEVARIPSDPLTLVEAMQLGRQQAVSAVLARLNVKLADARLGQRRADLLPSVSGSGRFTRQTLNFDEFGFPGVSGVTDPFNVWSFQVKASQTIYDASLWARQRAASDSAKAAGLDAIAAGDLAAATAGVAYVRVLGSGEAVSARLADSAIAADLLEQSRQLVLSGVSPPIDSTRSSVNFAAVRTQLIIARNQQDRNRLELARTLDLPPGGIVELADSLAVGGDQVPADADSAVAFALAHRTEMRAEQQRLDVSQRSLKAIRYENLPSLGAAGQYTESGNRLDGLEGSYSFGVGVNIPIFDGLKRQTRASEQSARVEEQQLRLHDTERQVETETRQALLDISAARQQSDLARDRLRLAVLELDQAEERFKAGIASSIETTNAQVNVVTARDVLIQARVALGVARLSAYRALGILADLQ
ncbi:MAG: TolC family protein [Gemmatimonadota bacterium]